MGNSKDLPAMHLRCMMHGYKARAVYLLTLLAEEDYTLGSLSIEKEKAKIKVTRIGGLVLDAIAQLEQDYPQTQVLAYQVMPDHLHLVLFVKEPLSFPLGRIVASFKGNCNKMLTALLAAQAKEAPAAPGRAGIVPCRTAPPSAPSPLPSAEPPGTQRDLQPARRVLWQAGFNDRILTGKDQLRHMIDYVHDNPRRLAVRRAASPFFRQQQLAVGEYRFAAMGNTALLRSPRLQVRCSRRLTAADIEAETRRFLSAARQGAVLVSPCISGGEKAVIRAALHEGRPVVLLRKNGFAEREKPYGLLFDACAEGRLLLLAPWQHTDRRSVVTRAECERLNVMATAVATTKEISTQ